MNSKATSKYPKPFPMNNFKPVLVLVVIAVTGFSFQNFDSIEPLYSDNHLKLPVLDYSPTHRNGKAVDAQKMPDVFVKDTWLELGFPEITEETAQALKFQKHVLAAGKFKDGQKLGNLNVTYSNFEEVIDILLEREGIQPDDLHSLLDVHQVWGGDKKGNVLFTGYFTPVLKAKKEKSGKYQYPIYADPGNWDGRMPDRAAIDGEGALAGLGLELAYTSDPVDISIMQLQGSGYVDFVDTGKRKLFRYAGHNGHRYRNIQNFFRNRDDIKIGNVSFRGIKRFLAKNPDLRDSVLFYNPSYTFFTPKNGSVKGSGEVPLIKAISIAADPKYFPAGSVLLASYPIFSGGRITHHEYRLLLPQDVGGAIKGPGHVDVYCGVGKAGEQMASNLHHYGKLWMLTPKRNLQVAEVM